MRVLPDENLPYKITIAFTTDLAIIWHLSKSSDLNPRSFRAGIQIG